MPRTYQDFKKKAVLSVKKREGRTRKKAAQVKRKREARDG